VPQIRPIKNFGAMLKQRKYCNSNQDKNVDWLLFTLPKTIETNGSWSSKKELLKKW
jgi:hypothetical protein